MLRHPLPGRFISRARSRVTHTDSHRRATPQVPSAGAAHVKSSITERRRRWQWRRAASCLACVHCHHSTSLSALQAHHLNVNRSQKDRVDLTKGEEQRSGKIGQRRRERRWPERLERLAERANQCGVDAVRFNSTSTFLPKQLEVILMMQREEMRSVIDDIRLIRCFWPIRKALAPGSG